MKKYFMIAFLLLGLIAGAMVLSSFATPKIEKRTDVSESYVDDEGWEDYCEVKAYLYKYSNGKYIDSGVYWSSCQVQRRAWCGAAEYRIHCASYNGWYPVQQSPVDGWRYCFYVGQSVIVFNF